MFQQTKHAAGIHMSTYTDKKGEDGGPKPDSPTELEEKLNPSISGWTPSPAWMARMREAEAKAGL